MTLDLSLLSERRRRPIIERFQRELVAELAAQLYPGLVAELGDERAFDAIQTHLVDEEGLPRELATVRFIRAAAREGR